MGDVWFGRYDLQKTCISSQRCNNTKHTQKLNPGLGTENGNSLFLQLCICMEPVVQLIAGYCPVKHIQTYSDQAYIPLTIRRPSARCISPDSTKVLRIQVTLVGALSASSTMSTCPYFTARTSGESSYDITPSCTVGCSVNVWTVVSLDSNTKTALEITT